MPKADHLRALNPEQLDAVCCIDGPLLVLAGAGTGKTRVVTCRIAEITARGTPADRICAVTFTNKAAAEMRDRVAALLPKRGRQPVISTFHSLGARILREFGGAIGVPPKFTIADSADQVDLVADAIRDLGLIAVMKASVAHGRISRWKTDARSPAAALRAASDAFEENLAHVYERYEIELARRGLVDFDDLIVKTLAVLEKDREVRERLQDRFRYLLVDEYQDTNDAQYELMCRLAGPAKNVCVVGDDDQSIYGWRGADPKRILRFQKDFEKARVVTLTRNYRSTQWILDAANRVIRHNPERRPKDLRSTIVDARPIELFIAPDEKEEMHFVGSGVERALAQGARPEAIAVLFRTNRQCRPLEVALRSRGIRYRVVGTFSFFDRREVRDLLAFGRAAANAADDSAFLRVFNLPPRGLGPAALEAVRRRAGERRSNLRPAAEELLADAAAALPARVRDGLRDLIDILGALAADAERSGTASAFESLIERVRYTDHLGKDAPEPLELATRLATVEDLVGMARDYDARRAETSLAGFLQGLALKEERDEDDRAAVSLLTIHAAKGLEFDHVFLAGVEEGILPHKSSLPPEGGEDEDAGVPALGIEEERRLFYVALTRARRALALSYVTSRVRWGAELESTPSRFLAEMGTDNVVVQDGTSREPASREFRRRAFEELAARFPPREAP